jgi:hypothetical protein
MRIVAFIEDEEVIKKILKHLGLWELKAGPPPKATEKTQDYHLDDSTFPAFECLPIFDLISAYNEGIPHNAFTSPFTHKAKSPILRPIKWEFLS